MLACPDLRYSALDPPPPVRLARMSGNGWEMVVGYKKKIGPRALHKKWDS